MLDLVDLMRQAGCPPWSAGAGVETLSPGPGTRDGVILSDSEPIETAATLDLVMVMSGTVPAGQGVDGHGTVLVKRHDVYGPDDRHDAWSGRVLEWPSGSMDAGFPGLAGCAQAPHFADGPYACYSGWPTSALLTRGPFSASLLPVERSISALWTGGAGTAGCWPRTGSSSTSRISSCSLGLIYFRRCTNTRSLRRGVNAKGICDIGRRRTVGQRFAVRGEPRIYAGGERLRGDRGNVCSLRHANSATGRMRLHAP